MSKYNSFAKRLDEAFKEAREQYETALETMKKAEASLSTAKSATSEKWPGEKAARIHAAEAAIAEAKNELRMDNIWGRFATTAKQIGAELEQNVKADGITVPDAIDTNGLELLKSGVMDADDYMAMLERYDENPTMLRLLSKYALEAADRDATNSDRSKLYHVGNAARNGRSEIMRTWESLENVALKCAGITSIGKSYHPKMGEYWDSETVQAFVEGF